MFRLVSLLLELDRGKMTLFGFKGFRYKLGDCCEEPDTTIRVGLHAVE